MKISKKGFTLIELLVVIAIIAILAAILFPVFARAREKARQTTCTSNQRQIAAVIQMYVQDHEETYPNTTDVWSKISVDPGVLICPTSGKKYLNGYGYSSVLANSAIGDFTDPTSTFVTVDTNPDTATYANIISSKRNVTYPHSGKPIASFADGHVATGDDFLYIAQFAGGLTKGPNNQVLVPDARNIGTTTAPLTLSTTGFTLDGKMSSLGVGKSGFVIFNWLQGGTDRAVLATGFSMTKNANWLTHNTAYPSYGGWAMRYYDSTGALQPGVGQSAGCINIGFNQTASMLFTPNDLGDHLLTLVHTRIFTHGGPAKYILQAGTKSAKYYISNQEISPPDALDSGQCVLQYKFRGEANLNMLGLRNSADRGDYAMLLAVFID